MLQQAIAILIQIQDNHQFNYIRNRVKVVVMLTMALLISTLQTLKIQLLILKKSIFPGLFKPLDTMPGVDKTYTISRFV